MGVVVDINGISRDMDHSMTNDDYERITHSERSSIIGGAGFLKLYADLSESPLHHHVWLRIVGLMETWDMRKHRLK